ncbi:Na/K ATPase alpha 1 subunit [Purpureocillium lavendulum]|uniref:Na/K ATPase alpha 1 subunit n=1 Tax=Purpureocillium lavendulum TaxID=1247861 RepID=A0AB34G2X8_9HYPO|nr:Na/K ATPase alpha 1 subunit [Purpureocillium lavendulum]
MADYDKELPILPLKRRQGGPAQRQPLDTRQPLANTPRHEMGASPHSAQIIATLRQQATELQMQKAALRRTLRQSQEHNGKLQKQIAAYKQYIEKQDEGLALVISSIRSSFENYRDSVVEATRQATVGAEDERLHGEGEGEGHQIWN